MMKYVIAVTLFALAGCSGPREDRPTNLLPAMIDDTNYDLTSCQPVETESARGVDTSVSVEIYRPKENSHGPANWMQLGETCLLAVISARLYESEENRKYDHYAISVESRDSIEVCHTPQAGGDCESETRDVSIVRYYQLLSKEMVGDSFENATMEDIVEFNAEAGLVEFYINGSTYTYEL